MAILFIGRSTLDLGYNCPRYPEEDSKLSSTSFTMSGGGPALNAAVTASALGSKARLISVVGKGTLATVVHRELDKFGIELVDLAASGEDVLPVSSIVVVPQTGSRTVIDQQPAPDLHAVDNADALLAGIDVVLTDGQFAPVAVEVLARARARSIPTVLDGGSWKPGTEQLLALIDHAIVSERFSPPDGSVGDLHDTIRRLGPRNVAVTHGPGPIDWSSGATRGEIIPANVEAVDTLGAGDIFHGAFCHYLGMDEPFERALEVAAEIAANSCTTFGTRAWIDEAGSWPEGRKR